MRAMLRVFTRPAAARFLLAAAFALVAGASFAAALKVETVKDDSGWRLLVDGKPFQVKGVVWSFTPIGENYAYDLFTKPDDYVRRTVDADMSLLKRMGANTIRCFSTIPPEWIEYIYARYGIMTIVNDMFGRYGVMVGGQWQPHTDYSDPATRRLLLDQAKKTFETYKDTRGVLFFMLGNESNYGLEWSSNAIENLPSGQRMDAKAHYLYTLFEEALKLGKSIDPLHPMGIVNGDLGYLDLIKDLVPDLDILGVNTYRGRKSYNAFYASIAETINKPMVFTEFGSDAYNVLTEQEDQYHQAEFIRDQWEEVYTQAYGKGKSQNVLGGFVFEWMDEWWKNGMETNLSVHDTAGTWTNGAYDFDATPGKMNMNEEWFGIVAQSESTDGGVHRRVPRAAYYLLQNVWKLDLYRSTAKQVKDTFAGASLSDAVALAEPAAEQDRFDSRSPLSVKGTIEERTFVTGTDKSIASGPVSIESNQTFRHVETASLDVALRPAEGLSGGATFKFGSPYRFYDAATGNPLSWFVAPAQFTWEKATSNPMSLYAAWASYDGPSLKADLYYRTGHPDWILSGDFFGLLPEAFDRYTADLNKQSAPFGIELNFKDSLEGLTLYGGPELYAGAPPTVMAKYWRDFGTIAIGAIHEEQIAYPDSSIASVPQVTAWKNVPLTRNSSLYAEGDYLPLLKVQAGLILGSPEKIGKTFTNAVAVAPGGGLLGSGWNIYTNQATTALDALGGKLRLSTNALSHTIGAYVQGLYLGPLVNGRWVIPRAGSQIFDPGTGNRYDIEAGLTFIYGNFAFAPKFLYRQPIYGPLPSVLGYSPRNYTDLFYVWGNRAAIQGEAVLTWDPTGATWFYDWNNDDREDSNLAASLSVLYNFHLGATDAGNFIADSQGTVYSFSAGLPAIDNTWSAKARLVARPLPSLRLIATAESGYVQSYADPSKPPVLYGAGTLRLALDRLMFDGEYSTNYWGPEYWYRQFQEVFPAQARLGVAWGFSPMSFMDQSNRVGIDFFYRGYDANSATDSQSELGILKYRYEVQGYINVSL